MGLQKTFTIIPPANPRPSGPPIRMTSHQVRAAYLASTRLPALSPIQRLEALRASQDRQRRQADKLRASSRAKAARDRKKAAEKLQAAERKRRGLPVTGPRASQDTIARFVRPDVPEVEVDGDLFPSASQQARELDEADEGKRKSDGRVCASQETEYGGDWVEEIAAELVL